MIIAPFSSDEECSIDLLQWYRVKTQRRDIFGYYTGAGICDEKGTIHGIILYTNFSKTNVDMHWYLPRLLSKSVLEFMFWYPFVDLGLKRITGFVNSDNKKLIKIITKIGFTLEATVKDYYNLSEDMLVYRIGPEEAQKWIK